MGDLADSAKLLRKIGDGPRRTGQLQDVHAGVGTIDNIDIPAVIDLDVIGLNGHLAGFPTACDRNTTLVGLPRNCRDIKGDLLWTVWITDIHGPHASVEVGDEHEAPIVDRRKRLVTGVRSEASTARTEVSTGFWYLKIRYRKWLRWRGDVHQEGHLPLLATLILNSLVDQDNEVGRLALLVLGQLRDVYPQDGKCGMDSDVRRGIKSANLSVQDVVGRWRERVRRGGITPEELVMIDDLQNTASARPIAEVDTIPESDRPMQRCRYWLS